MRLDISTPDLVCVQFVNEERCDIEARLRSLARGEVAEVVILCPEGSVTFRLRDSGMRIDCRDRRAIGVELVRPECEALADALAEQQAEGLGLPLDHSFESLGAEILLPEVRDVVIETVAGVDQVGVVDALRRWSDERYQQQAWLAADGPVVSSFSEDVCQLFDDTGLATALERGEAALSPEIDRKLQQFALRLEAIDAMQPPATLLSSPALAEIRALAKSILEAVDGASPS